MLPNITRYDAQHNTLCLRFNHVMFANDTRTYLRYAI